MAHDLYPQPTAAMTARREALAPEIHDAFVAFNKRVFADGALPQVPKEIVSKWIRR
jgi:hypothetical protein